MPDARVPIACLATALSVTSPIGIAAQSTLVYGKYPLDIQVEMAGKDIMLPTIVYSQAAKSRMLEALGLLSEDSDPKPAPQSLALANQFVNALPDGVRQAEMRVDDEGEVSIEWDWSDDCYCLLAFSKDEKRIFGALRYGKNRETFSLTSLRDVLEKSKAYFNA